jgi:hypothetical protein
VGSSAVLERFGVVVIMGLGVHGSLGGVAWDRIILRGVGVVARGSVSSGIILFCLSGVVIEGLGLYVGCCVVMRRGCGLLPTILRRHWYTSGRPSHQRCDTQQQHTAIPIQ